jgi:hypothetical protein
MRPLPTYQRLRPWRAPSLLGPWEQGRRDWIRQHRGDFPDEPLT